MGKLNKYKLHKLKNYCELKITNSKGGVYVTKIDKEDFNSVKEHHWYIRTDDYTVVAKICDKFKYLHHFVMGFTAIRGVLEIDHKNRDKLDNRKKNLRECTPSQNSINREKTNRNTSGYKGVFYSNDSFRLKKWFAQCTYKGKKHKKGYFDTKHEAAKAYNHIAFNLHGEFAYLNVLKKYKKKQI